MKPQVRNLLIIIAIVVVIIAFTVFAILKKKKISQKVDIIQNYIDSNTGALGEDIDSVLLNTTPVTGVSVKDIETLYSAKGGYFSLDKPEVITQVFAGKTKSYIKGLVISFQNKYGVKFNDFLNDIFDDLTGYDTEGYQKVLNVVKSAK